MTRILLLIAIATAALTTAIVCAVRKHYIASAIMCVVGLEFILKLRLEIKRDVNHK